MCYSSLTEALGAVCSAWWSPWLRGFSAYRSGANTREPLGASVFRDRIVSLGADHADRPPDVRCNRWKALGEGFPYRHARANDRCCAPRADDDRASAGGPRSSRTARSEQKRITSAVARGSPQSRPPRGRPESPIVADDEDDGEAALPAVRVRREDRVTGGRVASVNAWEGGSEAIRWNPSRRTRLETP